MSETKRDLQTEIYPRMFERAGDAFYWLQLTRRGNVWFGPVKLDGSAPRRPRHDKVRLDGDHIGLIKEQGLQDPVSYWDCVAAYEGIDPNDKPAMMQRLKEMAGLATDGPVTTSRPHKVEPRQQVEPDPQPEAFTAIYSALLDLGKDIDNMPELARDYWTKERGISLDVLWTWGVRYYSKKDRNETILQALRKQFQDADLSGAGVIAPGKDGKSSYYFFRYVSFLIPFMGPGGQVLHVQGRKWPGVDGDKTAKSLFPRTRDAREAGKPYSPIPLFYGGADLDDLPKGARIYMTEGIPDTLTAASLGVNAVGFPSTAAIKQHGAQAYAAKLWRFEVCFIPHNDEPEEDGSPGAGARFAVDVVNALRGQVAGLALLPVPESEGINDLNDYRVANMEKSNEEILNDLHAGAVDPCEMASTDPDAEPSTYAELIQREHDRAEQRIEGAIEGLYLGDPQHEFIKGKPSGFRHHFPLLEKYTDGVQPGVWVIAADSNVGKTAIMVNFCIEILKHNNGGNGKPAARCLFFTLDDTAAKIHRRFLSRLSIIHLKEIGKRISDDMKREQRDSAEGVLMEWARSARLDLIYEQKHKAIGDRIAAEAAKGPGLVVFIDGLHYLQTPESDRFHGEGKEEMAQAEQVKRWADDNGCTVITTAELRKTDKRGDDLSAGHPTMMDVAGSRRFSYAADVVLTLAAETDSAARSERTYMLNILPAKNKHGEGKRMIHAVFSTTCAGIYELESTGPEVERTTAIREAIQAAKARRERWAKVAELQREFVDLAPERAAAVLRKKINEVKGSNGGGGGSGNHSTPPVAKLKKMNVPAFDPEEV